MIKKTIADLPTFIAGDDTILSEVIHPKNDAVHLPYSLAHASIPVGGKSLPHTLTHSDELYYFLSGQGQIFIEEEHENVKSGEIVLVPAGSQQWVENTGESELVFICIVSPPWSADEEVVQ